MLKLSSQFPHHPISKFMSLLASFKNITTFVFDVDGVLTDGNVLVLEDGQQARTMNIKDGYAIQLAMKQGYHIIIISGAVSNAVKNRLHKLGVTDIYMGVADKIGVLAKHMELKNIRKEQVLYMGDDMPDMDVMKLAGLACCPQDAVPEIKHISRFISGNKGGQGCVREVIEKVLKLNGHWDHEQGVRAQ
jgi:3-deoxy-D-manno-octulosonate 8-phosphate phosphatase (KDO 8-P phosphatase)